MTRKPKIWFDYDYLASLDDPDAPREAFFLDEPAQQVLSQLAEMVLWDTRWFNGDPDDSHTLAHSIYEQLKMPLHFDDLIPYLDDVENLLQAILDHSDNSVIVDQLCCDNGVIAPLPDETGQDVVREVGDPPNGIVDWPTYDVHLCSSAQKFVDSLPGYITILQGLSILTTVGLAAAIAGLASGLAAAGIAASAVLGIQGALSFLESVRDLINIGPSWDDARTALEDSQTKQDLVCAIVLSSTAQQAETAIDNYLDGINSDAASSVRTLPLRFLMGQIFGAQADAGGYGGPCNCTATPIGPWDWGTSRNGWDGWATGGAGSSLDTTFMYRFTYGTYTSRTFTVSPSATQLTIVLNGQNNAVGSANVRINARDGSGAAALLDQKTNAMLELSPQDHTYVLDISGKTQNNIWVMIEKITGDTNGRTPIFTGSGEYI